MCSNPCAYVHMFVTGCGIYKYINIYIYHFTWERACGSVHMKHGVKSGTRFLRGPFMHDKWNTLHSHSAGERPGPLPFTRDDVTAGKSWCNSLRSHVTHPIQEDWSCSAFEAGLNILAISMFLLVWWMLTVIDFKHDEALHWPQHSFIWSLFIWSAFMCNYSLSYSYCFSHTHTLFLSYSLHQNMQAYNICM